MARDRLFYFDFRKSSYIMGASGSMAAAREADRFPALFRARMRNGKAKGYDERSAECIKRAGEKA
jgi:hypothetical protein